MSDKTRVANFSRRRSYMICTKSNQENWEHITAAELPDRIFSYGFYRSDLNLATIADMLVRMQVALDDGCVVVIGDGVKIQEQGAWYRDRQEADHGSHEA